MWALARIILGKTLCSFSASFSQHIKGYQPVLGVKKKKEKKKNSILEYTVPKLTLLASSPASLISPHFNRLCLALPHLASACLTLPCLTYPHPPSTRLASLVATPHFAMPHLASPQLTPRHLASPYLTSPHLTSPLGDTSSCLQVTPGPPPRGGGGGTLDIFG